MAIANLEAELGFALFERTHRETRPTPLALALEPHARLIADQLTQLQVHAIELSQGLESTLAIGVVPDIDHQPLLQAIGQISQRHPLLQVEVLSAPQEDALHLLHEGRVQLCLAFAGLTVDPRQRFEQVGMESLTATLSPHHPALGEQVRYLEDLVNVRQIVVASRDLPMLDPRVLIGASHWRTDSLSMAIEMVEAGLGWGDFPLSRIAPLLKAGRLVQLDFRNTRNELRLPVHAFWLKQQPLQRAAQELVRLLRQTAALAD